MKIDLKMIVTIIVMIVGLGVNWGIASGKIDSLETNVKILREDTNRRFVENDGRVRNLELTQAKITEALKSIQEDVTEIKVDVKTITVQVK